MVFKSTKGTGLARGLSEVAAWGYPGPEGLFALSGEGDVRQAIYSPESSFTETAAILLSTLFMEDIDPLLAARLSEKAFAEAPPILNIEEAIPIVDLAAGPTGSSADYGAGLLAGLLESREKKGDRSLIVSSPGPWGAALVEAASGIEGLHVLLLCGDDEDIRGVKAQRLFREGGRTILLGLRADRKGRVEFMRGLCGRSIAGYDLAVAGPGNPIEFAARVLLYAATFADLRRGASGELFVALPAESSLALASGLWAWRLGLPLTGLLLPHADRPAKEQTPEFGELVARFGSERSGLLGSILSGQDVAEDEAFAARDGLAARGGPALDRASALALAAAKRRLVPDLMGHAHFIVARHYHPFWESTPAWNTSEKPAGVAAALADARLDATIDPDSAQLEKVLESF
ncbi:MAG: hypothetical protein ACLQMF_18310 [Rectinemataceae bacterium]